MITGISENNININEIDIEILENILRIPDDTLYQYYINEYIKSKLNCICSDDSAIDIDHIKKIVGINIRREDIKSKIVKYIVGEELEYIYNELIKLTFILYDFISLNLILLADFYKNIGINKYDNKYKIDNKNKKSIIDQIKVKEKYNIELNKSSTISVIKPNYKKYYMSINRIDVDTIKNLEKNYPGYTNEKLMKEMYRLNQINMEYLVNIYIKSILANKFEYFIKYFIGTNREGNIVVDSVEYFANLIKNSITKVLDNINNDKRKLNDNICQKCKIFKKMGLNKIRKTKIYYNINKVIDNANKIIDELIKLCEACN
jgi:hypothetical protein